METKNIKKEVVIASYKETTTAMAWIKFIPKDWKVTVYNTSEEPRDFPKCVQAIHVSPNIGREANQWVHHICERYDTLADFTLFLQADKQHMTAEIDKLLYARKLPTSPFRYVGATKDKLESPSSVWPNGHFEPIEKLLKKAWLDKPIPANNRPSFGGGQFYITRDTIHNLSLNYYQRLLQAIRDPEGGSTGHYLEFSWGCAFKIDDL